jgi:YD repeat-containing protein
MNSARISRACGRVPGALLGLLSLWVISASLSGAGTEAFEYDGLGRLKKVTYANGSTTTYVLDAAGNRSSISASGSTPTYIAITGGAGAILPAAVGYYTVGSSCQGAGPFATVCTWQVFKAYGDHSPVVTAVDAPAGVNPGCNKGATQQIASGYSRSVCSLSVLSTTFGT